MNPVLMKILIFVFGMIPFILADVIVRKVCSKEKNEKDDLKKIGIRDGIIIVLGGVSALLASFYETGKIPAMITVYLILFLFTVISFIDLSTMLIHTASIWSFIALTVLSFFTMPHVGWVSRIIGAFCVSVPMLVLALVIEGAFGGGDIRLMWVGGLLLGWKLTLISMFFAFLCGGAVAIKIMLTEKKGRKTLFAFGPYLCIGMILALYWGEAVLAWYLGFFRH